MTEPNKEQDPDADVGFDEPDPDAEGDDSVLAERYDYKT